MWAGYTILSEISSVLYFRIFKFLTLFIYIDDERYLQSNGT
jgi:hypothetical protein